jgi:hypothetical protein
MQYKKAIALSRESLKKLAFEKKNSNTILFHVFYDLLKTKKKKKTDPTFIFMKEPNIK